MPTHRVLTAARRSNDLWVIYDPATRRHEPVQESAELCTPGQTVLRLFWCPQAQRHVSVPGASLHTILADGTCQLTGD
jgi:hypothetical protein